MKNKVNALIVCALISLTMVACHTHTHVVGRGAQTGMTESTRQWYAVFGLVPLGNADTKAMAGGANDYTITTQTTFIDGLISAITGIVTIDCRTVEVKR
jgi:hypothetical protein